MTKIKVILGTTRKARFGIQPATWIMGMAKEYPEATFELVDLAEQNLPFFDESTPPGMVQNGDYESASTRQWAKIVGEADGYIIVTAEYNYGIPAALKNALDTVSNEWNNKPVAFVSYGTGAGGARAVEHIRGAAGWLRLFDLREHVLISNYWSHLDENGTFKPAEHHTESANAMLKAIIFWSEQMKQAREALATDEAK